MHRLRVAIRVRLPDDRAAAGAGLTRRAMADVLVLGGTAWLGREVAMQSAQQGHAVTCLARGGNGRAPEEVEFISGDRSATDGYDAVRDRDWDEVVDVSWQPGLVRSAVAALGPRAAHWTYVSSCSVYADDATAGQDEGATLHAPLAAESASMQDYAGAKVRCERIVTEALGDRAALARAGLIGGPGDPSDRFGYWVARFAQAGEEPVLIPDNSDLPAQTIDVRDIASWIVRAPDRRVTGPVNLVGERLPLTTVLERAASVAGFSGPMVAVDPHWLLEQGVQPWAGPRSLPLWLPLPQYAGFGARDDARARHTGLTRRPLADTLADVLADERARGLDRERRAGLTRAEEKALLSRWADSKMS